MNGESLQGLPPPHKILRRFLKLKQEKNPYYSTRALARDLSISISYVSDILAGKKKVSPKRVSGIGAVLGMDEIAMELLRRSLLNEDLKKRRRKLGLHTRFSKKVKKNSLDEFVEISPRILRLLENWFNIAILDLVTCTNFRDDPNWIAKRLRISPKQAQSALKELAALNLIEKNGDQWAKTNKRIRLPTNQSYSQVRKFHQTMMAIASKMLSEQKALDSYKLRSIAGITLAGNKQNFAKAKDHLVRSLYECAVILAEGNCTEVYQLSWQLFPLTSDAGPGA